MHENLPQNPIRPGDVAIMELGEGAEGGLSFSYLSVDPELDNVGIYGVVEEETPVPPSLKA
ncbi:hypothetical protein D3C87_1105630 [compost metagenome]